MKLLPFLSLASLSTASIILIIDKPEPQPAGCLVNDKICLMTPSCCAGLVCRPYLNNSYKQCQPPVPEGCRSGPDDHCSYPTDCCAGLTCQGSRCVAAKALQGCISNGFCKSNSECCPGLICLTLRGISRCAAAPNTLQGCISNGFCKSNSECCPGLTCLTLRGISRCAAPPNNAGVVQQGQKQIVIEAPVDNDEM